MISEDAQDQAALYALGLLDADEAAAFESVLAGDGALRTLAAELREAAATLARTEVGNAAPPPELRSRVLARVAEDEKMSVAPGARKIVPGPSSWMRWTPWAAAAMLAIGCGVLAWQAASSRARYQETKDDSWTLKAPSIPGPADIRTDAVRQIVFCSLEPVPAKEQTGPQAAVVWDNLQRRGRLRIQKLPPPGDGKDYQLWIVEEGHKSPISAGVVKVNADGGASVEFQPGSGDDASAAVAAFALSVERAGGVPQNQGPILFVGKLQP